MSIDINKQVKEITYNGIPLDLGGTGGTGGTGGALVPIGGFVPNTLDSEGNIASGTWYGEKIPDYSFFTGSRTLPAGGEWWDKLVTVNLPNNLNEIGDYVFYDCSSLTLTSLPDSVAKVGQAAFHYTNLALTSLPDSLTEIGAYAFCGCSNLTTLSIPAGVNIIYGDAFSGCTNLTTVTFRGEGIPQEIGYQGVNKAVFDRCPNLTTINVPWALGDVSGAPWGATNATINYNYTG